MLKKNGAAGSQHGVCETRFLNCEQPAAQCNPDFVEVQRRIIVVTLIIVLFWNHYNKADYH